MYMLTFYDLKVEYGANMHDVEIIDTAGQEEFMSFRDSSMVHGDAFMALCAINSYSSWTELKVLREKIIREQDGDMNVPIVVVANKRVSRNPLFSYYFLKMLSTPLGPGRLKTSTSR